MRCLDVHVDMFANEPCKVVQHRDHKQFADVAYYDLYDQNEIQK